MTTKYVSITHLISDADLEVLMEAAPTAASNQELWELAKERLSAPSVASRRNAWKAFRQWFLDAEEPRAEPVVLAWYVLPDPQMRREVLHLERCRHLYTLDEFMAVVLYPQLEHVQFSLFGERQMPALTSAEIDAYVSERLPDLTERTRRVTRDKMRSLLVSAGLVLRSGTDFEGNWRFEYYRPTWQAWLYGLYREFEDDGHRKRAERFVAEEARLTHRFLIRPTDVLPLLSEGVRRGALEFEHFAGERYVRLVYPDTISLVQALAEDPNWS